MNKMIEVARNSVQAWEIDQMGHMNVQFYVDRAADGLAALAAHLGLGRDSIRATGRQLVAHGQHIRFLRERHVGSPFYLRAGVLDVGTDSLTVYQEMQDSISGEVAAAFTVDLSLRDVATHAHCGLPEPVRENAAHLIVAQPEHGRAKGLTLAAPRQALTLQDADAMGLVPTFQGQLCAQQCDPAGWLTLRHFMGIMSNAVPNLLAQTSGGDRSHTPEPGGASLEFRFVYRRYPRAEDVVAVRSGLVRVGEKTYVWCHWLFDLETGEALASAETVGVSLDLQERKVIPIPDAMRSRLLALLVEGLRA